MVTPLRSAYQPPVLFSQKKISHSNQPTVLYQPSATSQTNGLEGGNAVATRRMRARAGGN
jgi:hypothetical protein